MEECTLCTAISAKFSEGFLGNVLEALVSFREGFWWFLENSGSFGELSGESFEDFVEVSAKVSDFRDVSENVLEASWSFRSQQLMHKRV